jgi:serine/threonine protein kinase
VHAQDIKSANVLLKHREAKLADVGLSQMLRNSLVNSLKGVGTFCWAALEVLAGTHKARHALLLPACTCSMTGGHVCACMAVPSLYIGV